MVVKQQYKDFFAWWLQGMLLLLPERWLTRLRHSPDVVTVEQRENTLVFKRYDGADRRLSAERLVSLDDEAEKATVNHWLSEPEHAPNLILLLPQDSQLQKQLTYPLSTETELRSVLEFEMDKQTPFTSASVYFDYVITRRDTANDRLHLILYLVLRDVLHKHLAALRFLDLQPTVATTGSNDTSGNINFIPAPDRKMNNAAGRPLTRLALLTFIFIMASLYLPLLRYSATVEQVENQVEQSRTQAMQTQALINKKHAILEKINFLADRDQQHIPYIRYIHELTRRLPDNTWIHRLVIRDGKMQIQGESDAATSIIRILEESDYFEHAQFRSPVTKNNATGKEEFHAVSNINIVGP